MTSRRRHERRIYTGAILAIIPSVVIFAAFQRYFIKGMSIGAVKG